MGSNGHNFSGDKNPNYKTGLAPSKNRISLYCTWQNMKQRCLNEKNHKYKRYGGRGITICNEWMEIKGFYEWAKISGWSEGMTIDRIDNNGNYEPSNCRWVSRSENSKKKSTTKLSIEQVKEIKNKIAAGFTNRQLSKVYNVSDGTIWFIRHNITHRDSNA